MKVAEHFLGPQIDSAFSRKAVSEFKNRNALRPKEKQQRDEPEPNRNSAVGGNRRHHVQVEDRDHEQQNQIPTAEDTLEVRLVGIVRRQSPAP